MADDTRFTMAQVSAAPTNKALAATGGSGLGAAIATIVIHIIRSQFGPIPDDVTAAIAVLVTAIVTGLAAYFTPPGPSDGIVAVAPKPLPAAD